MSAYREEHIWQVRRQAKQSKYGGRKSERQEEWLYDVPTMCGRLYTCWKQPSTIKKNKYKWKNKKKDLGTIAYQNTQTKDSINSLLHLKASFL